MPKLLQINCDANWGSIGRITEQIGILVTKKGWESYIAYGRDYNTSSSKTIKIGWKFSVLEHYLENILFDNEGLSSRISTKLLISKIKKINPDIIHLHNIHDHYINYKILFAFLSKTKIPIVWTQHDCWAFTGGCMYYSLVNCTKWQVECCCCPQKKSLILKKTKKQYLLKKKYFLMPSNITLVPVSNWLSSEISKSFFKDSSIKVISNGIDVSKFIPVDGSDIRQRLGLENSKFVLAAATAWSKRKGLDDYILLAKILPPEIIIVLVGLSPKQISNLPNNIIGLQRTQNINEMVKLYSESSIVLNLSYEETFGLTTVEGFACGTPSIVYNCTASPELISLETGRIVEPGDLLGVKSAIMELLTIDEESISKACRERAVKYYDKEKCYKQYFDLYNSLL